ncbi:MAG: PBSX family phage terminase large subunit [Ilumatobacteraceae bacterium]
MRAPTLRLQIPEKMRPFLEPHRHKVAHGGRGGGKSWAVAQMLIARAVSTPTRWLCAREVQVSIKQSVHKLLDDQIKAMGLGAFFDVTATSIRGANGSEFFFAGMQDHTVDAMRSYESCDGAWVEEAHAVSERSAEVLIPTIRKPGSEIWWTYNPQSEDDYVHKRFVIQGDPNAVVCEVNWRDNPWFPPELELERVRLKGINTDLYNHVWEGHCRSLAGLLFKRDWFRWWTKRPTPVRMYMASDYAVTPDDGDYTSLGSWGLDAHGHLFALDWWTGQTDPATWIGAALDMARRMRPLVWFEEKGVILRAVDGAINKAMAEAQTFVPREALPSAGSKADRALGFAARASARTVWMPDTVEGKRIVDQLCAFHGQGNQRDDDVDVCSLMARGLDHTSNAVVPVKVERPAPPAFGTEAWIMARERAYAKGDDEKVRYYT